VKIDYDLTKLPSLILVVRFLDTVCLQRTVRDGWSGNFYSSDDLVMPEEYEKWQDTEG